MEWKNFDQLTSYSKLNALEAVDIKEPTAADNGAKRVKE